MNPDVAPRTPLQEILSLIFICAITVAVGCYAAAVNHNPVVSPLLEWLNAQLYYLLPGLDIFRNTKARMLAPSAAVGFAFFISSMPLAFWLAPLFNQAEKDNMRGQLERLSRPRDRKRGNRSNGNFRVN